MSGTSVDAAGSFPATERLYDENPYGTDFTAEVLSCCPAENPADGTACFAVVLDRTLFFPEEGGQTCDRGRLESSETEGDSGAGEPGCPAGPAEAGETQADFAVDAAGASQVLHVAIDEAAGIITHFCRGDFPVGSRVRGRIDFAHRFSNMQNHTGEHIFSGLVHSAYGYNNVGFHLSDDVMTMDYDGELTPEDVKGLERRANEAIWRNVPVHCTYPSEEKLAGLDYRSKKELKGRVRIVEIEGYDICACCAPHVKQTGEIGLLTVLSAIRYKGGTRISALCGKRAYDWLSSVKAEAAAVSNAFSVPVLSIGEAAENQLAEKKNLSFQISLLQQKILSLQLAAVPEKEADVLLFTEATDNTAIRNAVNTLTETHPGYVLLVSGEEGAYRFILGSRTKDCRAGAEALRRELAVRGGGSPEMVQGSIAAEKEKIQKAFEGLKEI